MIVQITRDYFGYRAGDEAQVDAGLGELLVLRGFATHPKPASKSRRRQARRAVKQPEESRSNEADENQLD